MLKVKNPWDQKVIQEIEFQKTNDIEVILESAKKNSLKKGLDFNLMKRIEVLENFFKIVSSNIDGLAKLASSEEGNPLKIQLSKLKEERKVLKRPLN